MSTSSRQFVADKIAQWVAHAVRHMAINEAWVKPSAAAHAKKVIVVHATVLKQPMSLAWRVSEEDILSAASIIDTEATLTLTLQPSIYAALAEMPFDLNRVMRHVRIEGDAGLAEWFNRLAQQLRPDVWEDLSGLIGDAPSTYLEQSTTYGLKQLKKTVSGLTAQAQYVLLDEAPIFVRHERLNELIQDTQDARYQLDRLEQRVALLRAKYS